MISKRQKHYLIVFFAAIWIAAIFAPIFVGDFKTPEGMHGAITTIIGGLLVAPTREENKKEQKKLEGGEEKE